MNELYHDEVFDLRPNGSIHFQHTMVAWTEEKRKKTLEDVGGNFCIEQSVNDAVENSDEGYDENESSQNDGEMIF